MKTRIVVISGPTGVGKTSVSIELAKRFDAEIISADSRQIYKYMDIGTAKPSMEERKAVLHHLIDIRYPDEEYNAALFRQDSLKIIEKLIKRKRNVFVVGGTGLYIKSLIEGIFEEDFRDDAIREELRLKAKKEGTKVLYEWLCDIDPVTCRKIHENDVVRIIRAIEVYLKSGKPISYWREKFTKKSDFYVLRLYLTREREELYNLINIRTENMIASGLVEEVESLLQMGYDLNLNSMRSIGYLQIVRYLRGDISIEKAKREIKKETRHYAKRQLTWLRSNVDSSTYWVHPDSLKEVCDRIDKFLKT